MTQSLDQSGDDGSQLTGQPDAADIANRDTRSTVTIAVVTGVVAVALVSLWTVSQPLADHALAVGTPWYYLGFLLLAIGAEIIYVPLRHGDTHEELTFFEILLLIGVLIFPPVLALTIPLVGYALAGVILRVDLRKLLFNLGSYALSSSILILVYGLFSDPTAQFSAQSTVALLLGAVLFASVNLGMLVWILHVDQGVPVKEFLRQEWVLSAIMAIGSVGVAATVVALSTYTPVLAPFVLLPAAALWYAYRSSAAQSESSDRNRWIVDFTAAVAEPGTQDDVVPAVANALRRVFNADDIRVILDDTTYGALGPGAELTATARTPADAELAGLGATEPQPIPTALLPARWHSGALVNITLAGSDTGAVLLGGTETINSVQSALPWARSAWRLQDVDAPVFQALSTAFASALRASESLQALIEESAKLSTVVDYASDGIAVLDPAGSVQMWSPAMVTITGIATTEALLTPPRNESALAATSDTSGNSQILTHFQSLALAAAAASESASISAVAGPRTHHELDLPIQRADGSERDLNLAVAWIAEDGVEDAVAIFTVRDMTRERRVERAKSDFIATVSHELKTPITPIKGYAQLLATRWDKMDTNKRLRVLDTIEQRADHLGRLVEDLLLSSKVSTDDPASSLQIHPQEVALGPLLADTVAAFPELADRLQVAQTDAIVQVDPLRAVQCLSNLLSNAQKYSESGTPITVTIQNNSNEETITVAVSDQGLGIPADELDKVFERFYRVEDPMTMSTGGSGLGLFISRYLAQAMGGDITAQSQLGVGSTFRMTLTRPNVTGSDS